MPLNRIVGVKRFGIRQGVGVLSDYIDSLIGVLEGLVQNDDVIDGQYQNVITMCTKWDCKLKIDFFEDRQERVAASNWKHQFEQFGY